MKRLICLLLMGMFLFGFASAGITHKDVANFNMEFNSDLYDIDMVLDDEILLTCSLKIGYNGSEYSDKDGIKELKKINSNIDLNMIAKTVKESTKGKEDEWGWALPNLNSNGVELDFLEIQCLPQNSLTNNDIDLIFEKEFVRYNAEDFDTMSLTNEMEVKWSEDKLTVYVWNGIDYKHKVDIPSKNVWISFMDECDWEVIDKNTYRVIGGDMEVCADPVTHSGIKIIVPDAKDSGIFDSYIDSFRDVNIDTGKTWTYEKDPQGNCNVTTATVTRQLRASCGTQNFLSTVWDSDVLHNVDDDTWDVTIGSIDNDDLGTSTDFITSGEEYEIFSHNGSELAGNLIWIENGTNAGNVYKIYNTIDDKMFLSMNVNLSGSQYYVLWNWFDLWNYSETNGLDCIERNGVTKLKSNQYMINGCYIELDGVSSSDKAYFGDSRVQLSFVFDYTGIQTCGNCWTNEMINILDNVVYRMGEYDDFGGWGGGAKGQVQIQTFKGRPRTVGAQTEILSPSNSQTTDSRHYKTQIGYGDASTGTISYRHDEIRETTGLYTLYGDNYDIVDFNFNDWADSLNTKTWEISGSWYLVDTYEGSLDKNYTLYDWDLNSDPDYYSGLFFIQKSCESGCAGQLENGWMLHIDSCFDCRDRLNNRGMLHSTNYPWYIGVTTQFKTIDGENNPLENVSVLCSDRHGLIPAINSSNPLPDTNLIDFNFTTDENGTHEQVIVEWEKTWVHTSTVKYDGVYYECIENHRASEDILPTNTTYWQVCAGCNSDDDYKWEIDEYYYKSGQLWDGFRSNLPINCTFSKEGYFDAHYYLDDINEGGEHWRGIYDVIKIYDTQTIQGVLHYYLDAINQKLMAVSG